LVPLSESCIKLILLAKRAAIAATKSIIRTSYTCTPLLSTLAWVFAWLGAALRLDGARVEVVEELLLGLDVLELAIAAAGTGFGSVELGPLSALELAASSDGAAAFFC